jgi:cytochrome oxidase assembly protein ShyY1
VTTAVRDPAPARTTTALAAVRLLGEWVWLRTLLLVILFAAICTFLGHWQWSRHVQKLDMISRVQANYDTPPVPLTELLSSATAPMPATLEWRQVRVTGTYDLAHATLVRNRTFNGASGYEQLVPLRTSGGADFVVDRGWIPTGRTGAEPDSVPAPPTGDITVIARLRPGETASQQVPPPGQAMRINLPELSARWGAPTFQAYGILAAESPAATSMPQLLPEPVLDQGPHQAYALQWWGFAAGAFVLLGYFAFREAQNRELRARGLDPAQVRKRPAVQPEEEW